MDRIFFVVETTGLGPVTPCMSSKYSNQLSYASTRMLCYYSTAQMILQEVFENFSCFSKYEYFVNILENYCIFEFPLYNNCITE